MSEKVERSSHTADMANKDEFDPLLGQRILKENALLLEERMKAQALMQRVRAFALNTVPISVAVGFILDPIYFLPGGLSVMYLMLDNIANGSARDQINAVRSFSDQKMTGNFELEINKHKKEISPEAMFNYQVMYTMAKDGNYKEALTSLGRLNEEHGINKEIIQSIFKPEEDGKAFDLMGTLMKDYKKSENYNNLDLEHLMIELQPFTIQEIDGEEQYTFTREGEEHHYR
jgi:hypothetical protein